MSRPYLAAALLIVAGTNAWVLAHVARNRSGAPDAEIELTSRELNDYPRSPDDKGVDLRLVWQNPAPQYLYGPFPAAGPGWFDQRKLEELGFDCSVPASDPKADRHYRALAPREIYVALEYDGPAWREWLAAREPGLRIEPRYHTDLTFEQRQEIERRTLSRLVAADAALDAAALRRMHPDRSKVLILRGVAIAVLEGSRVATAQQPAHEAYLRGGITRLLHETIHVPRPLSLIFGTGTDLDWTYRHGELKIEEPRYKVGLRTGSLHEPWVVSARRNR
jgi:hypothetical protein